MAKVKIEQDEYCTYHCEPASEGVDVPEETLTRWQKTLKLYAKMQAEMAELHPIYQEKLCEHRNALRISQQEKDAEFVEKLFSTSN